MLFVTQNFTSMQMFQACFLKEVSFEIAPALTLAPLGQGTFARGLEAGFSCSCFQERKPFRPLQLQTTCICANISSTQIYLKNYQCH